MGKTFPLYHCTSIFPWRMNMGHMGCVAQPRHIIDLWMFTFIKGLNIKILLILSKCHIFTFSSWKISELFLSCAPFKKKKGSQTDVGMLWPPYWVHVISLQHLPSSRAHNRTLGLWRAQSLLRMCLWIRKQWTNSQKDYSPTTYQICRTLSKRSKSSREYLLGVSWLALHLMVI